MPLILIKRVYEPHSRGDGRRILCDRFWPRGLSKEHAKISKWIKALAPSKELISWFHVNPEKRWKEFSKRYRKEIMESDTAHTEAKKLAQKSLTTQITLVYSVNNKYNNARVLKSLLTRIAARLVTHTKHKK